MPKRRSPLIKPMKRIFFASLATAVFFFTACKNADKKGGDKISDKSLQETADSLYQQVIDIHNEGMAGWMKIEKKQEMIKHLLDSVEALPAKMKAGAGPYKEKLNEAFGNLTTAYDEMDKWMPTLNLDSAKDNLEQRINYFTGEKLKAESINQAIFNSLQKADSLLKAKL